MNSQDRGALTKVFFKPGIDLNNELTSRPGSIARNLDTTRLNGALGELSRADANNDQANVVKAINKILRLIKKPPEDLLTEDQMIMIGLKSGK